MTNLEEIVFPSTFTSFGEGDGESCFSGTYSIRTAKFSNGITALPKEVCAYQQNLTSVSIPNTVTEIGDGAFYGCTSLGSISLPSNLTRIGEEAFCECTSLSSINIPSNLVTIGQYAFYGCTSISELYIPASVDNLGYGAFHDWTNEQTIKMGKTEQPALVNESYAKIGWQKDWKYSCNATVLWGQ